MDDKIIQIMPAPSNLYAVYNNDGTEIEEHILCLALTESGEIVLMDIDVNGQVDTLATVTNFKRIVWR